MAADPAGCKIQIINGEIFKEWTATFGEFKGLLKPAKPSMACTQSDWKAMLTQWLIFQCIMAMVCFPLRFIVGLVGAVVGGGDISLVLVPGIIAMVQNVITAFILGWVGWFMMIKREPNCCCLCIIWFEGWKYQHLLYGIITILNGAQALLNAVQALLSAITNYPFLWMIFVVVECVLVAIFAITQLYVGRAACGLGQEISGVKMGGEGVGKAGDAEEAKQ